jgi:hypothetical protein
METPAKGHLVQQSGIAYSADAMKSRKNTNRMITMARRLDSRNKSENDGGAHMTTVCTYHAE